MSQQVLTALKDAIAFYEAKREAADKMISQLVQTIAIFEEEAGSTAPHKAKRDAPTKTKTPKAPAVQRSGLHPYTREDVVAVALRVIKAEGPVKATRITEEVLKHFKPAGTIAAGHLSYEVNRGAQSRLIRTDDGRYAVRMSAPKGPIAHGPAESEKLLAQARSNADRPATSDIRV